jgi:hypothetical protein
MDARWTDVAATSVLNSFVYLNLTVADFSLVVCDYDNMLKEGNHESAMEQRC